MDHAGSTPAGHANFLIHMKKILLLGDKCIDEYQYGDVSRISPEAPVPIFNYLSTEKKPGMAANVKKNLETLGLTVISYFGEESTKIRLIDQKSSQQLIRIDNDIISSPLTWSDLTFDDINVDAIVISDYNKGFISYELIEQLRKRFNGPIFIDSKKPDLARFNGCFVKINEHEYLQRISTCDNLIITCGSREVVYQTYKKTTHFSVPKINAFDVCGAGDTFLSALTYFYLQSNQIDSAIEFAIRASAITVQHIGVYSPDITEL